jgi:hypothetical protein
MRNLFTIILCVLSIQLYSQKSNKTIYEKKFGTIECKFDRVIDLSESDTSYYIYCGFQNIKYSSIVDLGSVFITNQTDLLKIIEDLKECVKYMDDKSISYSVEQKRYIGTQSEEVVGSFRIFDFSKNLYIYDLSQLTEKYTQINKKKLLKWIDWLEMVGNDKLLR